MDFFWHFEVYSLGVGGEYGCLVFPSPPARSYSPINLPAPALAPRDGANRMVAEPFLRMTSVTHVPTASTNRHEILERISFLAPSRGRRERGAAFGARIRHAEPKHADDASRHVAAASWAHGARSRIPEYGAVVRDAGGRAWVGRRRVIFRVAVQRLVAVVAAERHLAGVRRKKRFLAIGGDGEFGRLNVELNAWEKEAGGIEKGAVRVTPVIDERVGEVARRGMRKREKGGLHVGEFHGVGLPEGNGLFREASEDYAFDGAMLNAVRGHGGDVFGQFLVVEIHERNANSVTEGQRRLGQDVMPVSVAYQRKNCSGIGVVKFFGHVPDGFVPCIIRVSLYEACQRK